jgi:ubiquitin related modifier 1
MLIPPSSVPVSGGLELLFDKKKDHNLEVPDTAAKESDGRLKMRDLLAWMKTNLLKERPELFLVDDSV